MGGPWGKLLRIACFTEESEATLVTIDLPFLKKKTKPYFIHSFGIKLNLRHYKKKLKQVSLGISPSKQHPKVTRWRVPEPESALGRLPSSLEFLTPQQM